MTEPEDKAQFQAYFNQVRRQFQVPMDRALKLGFRQGIPTQAIGVAVVMVAMRCAAMAIVGSRLDPKEFEGTLDKAVADVRAMRATERKLQ